jgi:hypothetical protein
VAIALSSIRSPEAIMRLDALPCRAMTETTPTPTPTSRPRWPWIVAAIAALAIAAGGITWALWPSLADRAAERCHDLVTDRLRAPSTAVWASTQIEDRGNGRFFVWGEIDAQNGFGAQVRSRYSCELYTPDGGGRWSTNAVKVG